jgi:pyruvate-formate lyase-activating enzyme
MLCGYCERACDIQEAMNGHCRMYRNEAGTITENFPDAYLNVYTVTSESIPVLHFYPNHTFLLISTIGCNFTCEGCISEFQTIRPGTLHEVLTKYTPEQILAIAREGGCRGITFCLNEPAVSLPTFLRVAEAAKTEGFLVGCSSNGYMTPEALEILLPYLDFVNIGLKGSTDERYRECGAASAAPVYRNLQALYDAGVAVEVSAMYLKGREPEIVGAAERVRAISPEIPFQVMRFIATREDLEAVTPTKEQAEQMCETLRQYLPHVYLFNTLATTELDSRCPVCGKTVVHRVFFGPMAARVVSCRPGGVCSCGYRFPCKGEIAPIPGGELPVLGGYRSIMGVKYVAGLARMLGETDEREIDRIGNTVIANGYLRDLQTHTGTIEGTLEILRYVSTLCGREEQAGRIADYVTAVIADIRARVPDGKRPRVFAVMSHPLLPMYAAKFANLFVEMAGGISLNRELGLKESTDAEYTVEAFTRLDPEVILVAGPADDPVLVFCKACVELDISCNALSTGRVFALGISCGSGPLQLVLSLMDIANILHPEVFRFSLADEEVRYNRAINGVAS